MEAPPRRVVDCVEALGLDGPDITCVHCCLPDSGGLADVFVAVSGASVSG